MAKRNDIQYIRYYTPGTAVPKTVRQTNTKHLPDGPAPAQERKSIPVDPVSMVGTVVSVLLLVCMLVGLFQLHGISAQIREAESRIAVLKAENAMLDEEFRSSYDLEEIRVAASALGMIPEEEALHVNVRVEVPVQQEEPGWLEQMFLDFKALFE